MTQTPLPEQERKFARIQVRRDKAKLWEDAALPYAKLLEGEIGLETDTGKFKIGDGVTDWPELPYWDRNAGKIILSEEPPNEDDYDFGQLWFSTIANELRILLEDCAGLKVWSVVSIPISNQDAFESLSCDVEGVLDRLAKLEEDIVAMGNMWFDGEWIHVKQIALGGIQLVCNALGGNLLSDKYSDVDEIRICKTDLNGVKFSFKELKVGTYFRLADSMGKAIYRITEDKSEGSPETGTFGVEFVHADQDQTLGYPDDVSKFYVQAVSAGQKDLNPADYVLKDPKGEPQVIETGAFAIKGDGTHEGSTAEEKSIQTKESVDAAIKAFEDGTLQDKHYAVKDGDNTWTGKNDYKEYPTSEVVQTSQPEKVKDTTNIMNQLVRYQTVVDYIKDHPTGEGSLDDYLNKEEGGDVKHRVTIFHPENNAALKVMNTGTINSASTIFYATAGNNWTQFRVKSNGAVQAGHNDEYPYIAKDPHDLITKAYTDNCFKFFGYQSGVHTWEQGLERAGTCWRQSSVEETTTIYFSMIKKGGGMFLPPWTSSHTGEDPVDSYKVKVPVDIYFKQDPPDWPDSLDPEHGKRSVKQKLNKAKQPSTKEVAEDELESGEMSTADQYFNKKLVWPNGLTLYRKTHLYSISQDTYNRGGHSPTEKKRWYLPVLKLVLEDGPVLTQGKEYFFHFGA